MPFHERLDLKPFPQSFLHKFKYLTVKFFNEDIKFFERMFFLKIVFCCKDFVNLWLY